MSSIIYRSFGLIEDETKSKLGGWCEGVPDRYHVLWSDNDQMAFGYRQLFNGDFSREEYHPAEMNIREGIVRSRPARDLFKAWGCNIIADFLVYFPHDTIQKAFFAFTSATK